LFEFLKVVLS